MSPPPQLALELLARHGVLGRQEFSGGYNNRVWRIYCEGGRTFIVKRYRAPWLMANERAAIRTLGPSGLAPPSIEAEGASFLIWPENDALVTPKLLEEGLVRAVGYALSRLHASRGIRPADPAEKPDWRIVNQIAQAAAAHGFSPVFDAAVHGDVWPGNVLVDAAGRFVRFCDYEEFGPGDPMADLMLALVEHSCAVPERADAVCAWLWRGYAGGPNAPDLSRIADARHRAALADSAYETLNAWAISNGEAELTARLKRGWAEASKAISRL